MNIIVGVFVRTKKGKMFGMLTPARHHHLFKLNSQRFKSIEEFDDPIIWQGFITSNDEIVSRERALQIAIDADQIITNRQNMKQLYSEDVCGKKLK